MLHTQLIREPIVLGRVLLYFFSLRRDCPRENAYDFVYDHMTCHIRDGGCKTNKTLTFIERSISEIVNDYIKSFPGLDSDDGKRLQKFAF